MDSISVAVVGFGLGGAAFHAPLIDVTPGLTLSAIVTSNPDRQEAARKRYSGVQAVPTVDDLLASGDDLDLAVVTVPNAAHVAVAETFLRAGVSVVIDKPVAPTFAEGQHLANLAEELSLRVIPYLNR
ncbi:MAG TPA: Gfo/Idh/MocA family oxidoreductase, partial [Acidimicrobiales bacterium]|nr:Gfo/Idh/MocA family oxidoreductase [Acidimicrobiales bacterium]